MGLATEVAKADTGATMKLGIEIYGMSPATIEIKELPFGESIDMEDERAEMNLAHILKECLFDAQIDSLIQHLEETDEDPED